jgi:hypothetical protein
MMQPMGFPPMMPMPGYPMPGCKYYHIESFDNFFRRCISGHDANNDAANTNAGGWKCVCTVYCHSSAAVFEHANGANCRIIDNNNSSDTGDISGIQQCIDC